MLPPINTVVLEFAYRVSGTAVQINTIYVNKQQWTVTVAYLEDDLISRLLTLLWPCIKWLTVVALDKDCYAGVKEIVKSQGCDRQLTAKGRNRLEEVTVKAVSQYFSFFLSSSLNLAAVGTESLKQSTPG